MNVALALLSFVVPLLLGFMLINLLWPEGRLFRDFALKCCLSVGFGLGAASCLTFGWIAVAGQISRWLFLVEFVVLLALSVILVRRVGRAESSEIFSGARTDKPIWLRAAASIALVSSAIQFVLTSLISPHGEFDAFAIWNLRARFLYRGGSNWTHFRYMTWSKPDYPLLLPASVARSWEFIGQESQLIPAAIGFLFTFSLIGLVYLTISRLRGERQGLLAALVLLGTPFLISHGASQYADVPLTFLFTASICLFLLYAESESDSRYKFLVLSGIASGLAAWTKNEGLLFGVVFLLLQCMAIVLFKDRGSRTPKLFLWLAGWVPVIIVVALYKLLLAGSNDVVSANNLTGIAHDLVALGRFRMVMANLGRGFLSFGMWSQEVAIPLLLVFYFLLLGPSIQKRLIPAAMIVTSVPILMFCGYVIIYMISPHDLNWHLESSSNRLLLQLWPLWILAFFTIVRPPEKEILAASSTAGEATE